MTKRALKCAVVIWLCLVAFVITVRAAGLELAGVRPEAVMLTFLMTLPFTMGLTLVVIVFIWVRESRYE